ncbi:MAG: hypothetical protein B6D61_11785 [Bacteroidetes bacterium 4484_249]|nr:MAG: hypothetical protein B6D61_11785 [Bacteroidetes bacterium 4484_249]
MRDNGGFATLGFLNRNVDVSEWKTKTPYASIRRIIQNDKLFFKIKPGLWALNDSKDFVLQKFKIQEKNTKEEKDIFLHTYFQGLLVEIGKMKNYFTYIPPQDKSKLFLDKPLHLIANTTKIFDFTYNEIVKRAKTVDVVWFNERNMPSSFFEVEHSTDIKNSLSKFDDLQDFYSKFYIVGSINRKDEFQSIVSRYTYKGIRKRISFVDYEYISNLHAKTTALFEFGDIL